MEKIVWLAVFLSLITFNHRDAFASSPLRPVTYSAEIERRFIAADLVFDGVLESSSPGRDVFSVKEVYKAPQDEKYKGPKIEITREGNGRSAHIGLEAIVYASIDREGRAHFSEPILAPNEVIEAAKKPDGDAAHPNTIVSKHFPLVFVGKVVEETHHWVDQWNHPFAKSEIKFKISSVLRNLGSLKLENTEEILVYTSECGEKFRMGREYIVFAAIGHKQRNLAYFADCQFRSPYDLHERELLSYYKLIGGYKRE